MPGGFSNGFDNGFGVSPTTSKSVGGILTPNGTVMAVLLILRPVGGTLTLSGAVVASNPAWQLIDEVLAWLGNWDELYPYNINDNVLYQTSSTAAWHVFVSKTGHNVGNQPTTSPANWRRLYQEQWI